MQEKILKDSRSNSLKTALKYAFLILYTFISVYPLIWMIFYSFKNNSEIFVTNPFLLPKVWRIENYYRAVTQYDITVFFKNSTVITFFTLIFTLLLSLMFSYATARMKWKLSSACRLYISLGMFIPIQMILIPLVIFVRKLHISNTHISLIIPYIAFQLAFSSIILYGFFKSIPFEMEESAAIDGASIYRCFFSIIIPLVKPAIATVSIFIFLQTWNEFTTALILISDNKMKTIPLGLLSFQGKFATDWGAMGASMVIASIPTIIIYLVFSSQVEKAISIGSGVKG